MDAFLVVLPGLLFDVLVVLPLLLGTMFAIRHWWTDARPRYFQNLFGSMAAGAVLLGLLWSSLFGDSLSKSSTGGLIFAIAPFYAAAAQGIVYFLTAAFFRKSPARARVPPLAWCAIVLPLLMLAVLAFGMVKQEMAGHDADIAQRASDPAAMRRALEKARTGQADAFAVPLHLAQNPDAPADILAALALHEHPAVRAQVARNANTPKAVVASLRYDCASFVRKIVAERLGPDRGSGPAPAPSGMCALERWR